MDSWQNSTINLNKNYGKYFLNYSKKREKEHFQTMQPVLLPYQNNVETQ